MRIASSLLMSLATLIITFNCYAVESTEAQRQYDLALSYIKSDLYEDGLKTLNQVAFLYDSDVADDALYQLALIREQVGDGKLNIGEQKSIDTVNEEINRLNKAYYGTGKYATLNSVLGIIVADMKGKQVLKEWQNKTITQYILALDYLNTLTNRYPNSDRKNDVTQSFNRITAKMNAIISPQQPEPIKTKISAGCVIGTIIIAGILAGVLGAIHK